MAALFDAPRPGASEPQPSEPSVEDPSEEPAPTPTQAPEPGAGATLPEPVVTVTVKDLVLHGPDGEQVLYTLPQEGESTFLSVAVRPGLDRRRPHDRRAAPRRGHAGLPHLPLRRR